MHVDRALINVDVGAPHPVEQLLAREDTARALHQELEQAIFGRAEIDGAAGAHDAFALAVWNGDEEIDAICTSLFRELLTYMMEDPRHITFCIHLMFCAKNIERMGDHATNIAETVYYMVEGHAIADQRRKGDTTAFAPLAAEK